MSTDETGATPTPGEGASPETATEVTATSGTETPPGRTTRDMLEQMWSSWPFGNLVWPLRELADTAGLPIRVEEVTEGDTVVVRAELPGVDPEKDVTVSLDGDVLTIRAERRERSEQKTSGSYRSEFRYGSFVRQVRLPRGTTPEVISATYRDGVLEVRLPAPSTADTSRTIPVSRG